MHTSIFDTRDTLLNTNILHSSRGGKLCDKQTKMQCDKCDFLHCKANKRKLHQLSLSQLQYLFEEQWTGGLYNSMAKTYVSQRTLSLWFYIIAQINNVESCLDTTPIGYFVPLNSSILET